MGRGCSKISSLIQGVPTKIRTSFRRPSRVRSLATPTSLSRSPSTPDGPALLEPVRKEDLNKIVEVLEDAFSQKSTKSSTEDGIYSDTIFGGERFSMLRNEIDQPGQALIYEAAANAQHMVLDYSASKECLRTLETLLTGLGSLHWITSGLLLIAWGIKRIEMVQSSDSEAWAVMERLKELAKHVIESMDILDEAKLMKVYKLIRQHLKICLHQIHGSSVSRYGLASVHSQLLTDVSTDIDRLMQDLCLSVTIAGAQRPIVSPKFKEHDDKVGLNDQIALLMKHLDPPEKDPQSNSEVRAAVIHGMPGVGTSTLAEAVCARLAKKPVGVRYRERKTCRVYMKQFSKERDLKEKQSDIMESLSKKKYKIPDCKSGIDELKKYFSDHKDEPVLIFIDNLENAKQVQDMFPTDLAKCLPPGSRLVVSTFSERVSQEIRRGIKSTYVHHLKELEEADARRLLCNKVYGQPQPPAGDEEAVDKILKVVRGLPLAIDVLGHESTHPRWQDKRKFFNHAYKTLSDGDPIGQIVKEDRLRASLQVAHDEMGKGEILERVYLDICTTFVEGDWVEGLQRYGVNLEALEGICQVIKEELSDSDGRPLEVLGMQPLVVAFGQRVDRQNPDVRVLSNNDDDPEIISTLVRCEPQNNPCGHDRATLEKVEVLLVENCKRSLPMGPVQWCKNLRHLEVRKTKLENTCNRCPSDLEILILDCPESRLPMDLTSMNKLIVLKIHSNPWADEDLRGFKTPPKLKSLFLHGSEIEEIGLGGHELRQVTFEDCGKLQRLGPLSSCLTHLSITGSPKLECLSNKLAHPDMRDLQHVSLRGCGIKEFRVPPHVRTLDLSNNPELWKLTVSGDIQNLKRLVVRNCFILHEVPDVLMDKLRPSDIEGCPELQKRDNLPERLKKYTKFKQTLRELFAAKCPSHKSWFRKSASFKVFQKLRSWTFGER